MIERQIIWQQVENNTKMGKTSSPHLPLSSPPHKPSSRTSSHHLFTTRSPSSAHPEEARRSNMATLNIDPPTLQVPANGGESAHQLINPGETRLAFKVKSSNNDHYRLNPVYGYVEPGASTEIKVIRLVRLPLLTHGVPNGRGDYIS